VATVRQLPSGGFSVQISQPELALIKTALQQSQRLSRFGMEALEAADHATNGRRAESTRLRREAETLAMREASLRSLRQAMAEADQVQAVPVPRRPGSLS
jgi:hypothetical protein